MLSSHGILLTIAMYHHRDTIIQLTQYDDTEKRAQDSQIVRANENLKLSYGGLSYSQASCTNLKIKALCQSRH